MKILKIFLCAAFIFTIAACSSKDDHHYEYPDEDPTTEKGNIGDPCVKNDDCKDGLFCIDKKCGRPSPDEDTNDDDNDADTQDDTNPDDDTDTDTDTGDHDADTDTDEPDKDEDYADDEDTVPDDDSDTEEPVYIPECGNGIRDPGEECDNGLENNDDPGISGVTCRTNCYFARCGDNILDSGEVCDDGNFESGDYCSYDCHAVTGYCGDGIQQNNEECDKGNDPYCSDDCSEITGFCGDGTKQSNEICDNAEPDVGNGEGTGPYYCNVSCSKIIGSCGDSIVQLNEICDHGDNNGRYGYCASDCSGLGERCGDGIKQSNEACDDGNTKDGDYCSADCQTSYGSCGDGIVQSFEACDKSKNGDGIGAYCSDDCKQILGQCGDAEINGEEECDLGVGINGIKMDCEYGSVMGCDVCTIDCRKTAGIPRYCGDGVISTMAGEVCDKANFGNGIGAYCSDNCKQIVGRCGDGIKQENEVCDTALDPYCSSDCKRVEGSCGDNIKNGNEECDLGADNGKTDCAYGERSCTVCTTTCKNASGNTFYCGDGNRDSEYGEACDNGINNGKYGYCKSDCSGIGEHCGDGIKQSNEECDSGEDNGRTECEYGLKSCILCTSTCVETYGHATYCGDNIVNGNETCDDGDDLNGTYGHCSADCYGSGERCGDNIVNGNETCDDGDGLNGTYGHCKNDCSGYGRRCGDGVVDIANGETCDDGTNNGKYRQTAPGYCNSDCSGYGEGGYCGDEQQNGTEQCDNGADNGKTDCEYGEESCKVCNSSCQLRNGSPSYCGDGIINSDNGETCDDGIYNSEYGGHCKLNCKGFSPKCGDGNIDTEHGETCDDGNNNGKYKQDFPGYCDSDCQGEGSAGYCGDNIVNGNETCDDGIINGEYGGHCNSNCNGFTPYCGDSYVDTAYGEVCDSGTNNGHYGYCNNACSAVIECGDAIVNGDEDCDLGQDINGSVTDCAYGEMSCIVCSDSCRNVEGNTSYCGDGNIDAANDEICDDKENNGSYGYCNSNCKGLMPYCGDGNIDSAYGETCDDGEDNGTYGKCNTACNGTVKCGDSVTSDGEYCDEGLLNGTYGHCNDSCTAKIGLCGDGIWQNDNCGGVEGCIEIPEGPEECDYGYQNGATECEYGKKQCYVCTLSCMKIEGNTSYCGDGNIDYAHGEACDDGELNGTFGKCTSTCSGTVTWRCGDGNVDYTHGEVCDNGDDLNGLPGYCNLTCDGWTPYCGDGTIQRSDCTGYSNCEKVDSMDEECDDRFMNGAQGFCYSDCSGKCGDNKLQSAFETCDEGELNGTVGHCNWTCDGDTPVCGNGIIEKGEACDDGGDNGKYGHCNPDCGSWNAAGYCGDGKIQVSDASDCGAFVMCDENTTENCCELTVFAAGDTSEICDEEKLNGYHGHCNETCDGTSSCGDGTVGKDEMCEPGLLKQPVPCETIAQFKSGTISECDSNCIPILTDCVNADSYTSPFFETYQTLCYNNLAAITCPAAGDPFFGQEPNYSYTAHDFETISEGAVINEKISELMWQTDTPAYYGYEKEGVITYDCSAETSCTLEEARDLCSDAHTGDYNDWRLPTVAELSTILDYTASAHIYSGFTNTSGNYWTEEGVLFSSSDGTFYPVSSGTAQVKCVRSNSGKPTCSSLQCIEKGRISVFGFTDFIMTIYDNSGTVFNMWYFDDPMNSENWEDALALCESIDFNSINKMRLPTVNELMWLIDRENGGSLINGFTGKAWTSTTLSTDPTKAYAVDFSTGSVVTDTKGTNNIVICVE